MNNVVQIDFTKIREAAKATGLSTRKIAKRAGGISHQVVFAVLTNDEANPSAINLKKVCDVIGVPIEDAFLELKTAA